MPGFALKPPQPAKAVRYFLLGWAPEDIARENLSCVEVVSCWRDYALFVYSRLSSPIVAIKVFYHQSFVPQNQCYVATIDTECAQISGCIMRPPSSCFRSKGCPRKLTPYDEGLSICRWVFVAALVPYHHRCRLFFSHPCCRLFPPLILDPILLLINY